MGGNSLDLRTVSRGAESVIEIGLMINRLLIAGEEEGNA